MTTEPETIRAAVRDRYASAARAASDNSCCGPTGTASGLIGRSLYGATDVEALPAAALSASLGCGNPTMLADLKPGDVVLDLGSGGGIDVLLSARRVGPAGIAYGLDMTPEMLELAEKNRAEAGVSNARWLLGTIENIPLPDCSVDVVISNCVVNLSPDKDAVLRESFRVLKPGGRLAISDIVLRRPISGSTQALMGLWTGCIAGALIAETYQAKLEEAGFEHVGIEPTRIFETDDIAAMAGDLAVEVPEARAVDEIIGELGGSIMSAFVRGRKPTTS
jgi:SAM-dependent methyltransferase